MIAATCIACGCSFTRAEDEDWKRLCVRCWKASKGLDRDRANPLTASPIPPEMLARLIRLCHPDRHGNSEAANVATAWLLEQRP